MNVLQWGRTRISTSRDSIYDSVLPIHKIRFRLKTQLFQFFRFDDTVTCGRGLTDAHNNILSGNGCKANRCMGTLHENTPWQPWYCSGEAGHVFDRNAHVNDVKDPPAVQSSEQSSSVREPEKSLHRRVGRLCYETLTV